MSVWLHVIGLGEGGAKDLSPHLQKLLDEAELIVGGRRHLDLIGPRSGLEHEWQNPISHSIAEIDRWRFRRVVVLASGDPMHFGIGVTLNKYIAADEMKIHPAPSSFSLAAAAMFWPLQEVACLSAHHRPLASLSRELLPGRKLLILTENGESPAACAEWLLNQGYGQSQMSVFEHIGGPKEYKRTFMAKDWPREEKTADLNIIAIECALNCDGEALSWAPGLPDEAYIHDGKITKSEARAVTMAGLRPMPGELLWDVGAGSGSVAIEWMRHHRLMQAIAVEQDETKLRQIHENAKQLGVPELRIVAGWAPDALKDLPSPHAIFIGGGARSPGLIETCWAALKPGGRIVMNAVTAEGEGVMLAAYAQYGGDMLRLQVQHLSPLGSKHKGWRPAMPLTQWRAVKK